MQKRIGEYFKLMVENQSALRYVLCYTERDNSELGEGELSFMLEQWLGRESCVLTMCVKSIHPTVMHISRCLLDILATFLKCY